MTEPLDPYAWEPNSKPFAGTPFDENMHATGDVNPVPAEYEGPMEPIPVTLVTNKPALPQIFEHAGPVPFSTDPGFADFEPHLLVPAGRGDRSIRRLTFAATSGQPPTEGQVNVACRFAVAQPGAQPTMEPRTLLAASYWPMSADVVSWIDNDAPPVPYLLHSGEAIYFDLSWYVREAGLLPVSPDVVIYVRAEVS